MTSNTTATTGNYTNATTTGNYTNDHQPYVVSTDAGWKPGVSIAMTDGVVMERPDVLLFNDGRGYMLRLDDGRYLAGCRNFNYDEAVAHWSNPNHRAPESARLLLEAVQAHHQATAK